MQHGVQATDFGETAIWSRGVRPGADGHEIRLWLVGTDRIAPSLSVDVGEYFPILLVEAQDLGRRSEASFAKVPEVCMDGRCPGSCRTMHGVANPHHAGGASAAAEPLLRHAPMMA
jgi:hypothetical protein